MNDDKLKMALDYAADARKTEISLLWSRSLYFWGFISVMLVAYGAAIKEKQFTLAFISSCISFIISLCWTLVNRSSKYWQEVWEWKTENISQDLLRIKLFTASDDLPIDLSRWWGPKRFSPSKLVMAVSDMAVVTWLFVGIATITQEAYCLNVFIDVLILFITIFYAAYILKTCRSGSAVSWKKLFSELKCLWPLTWSSRVSNGDC